MQPLKVALIIKNSAAPKQRDARNMGYFSYAVPEFEWTHFWFAKNTAVDLNTFRDFDLVYHEDTTNGVKYHSPGVVPLVFMDIDSTLSERHLHRRRLIAYQADLILVDHAPLNDFSEGRGKVRRLGYCVNDLVFKDYAQNKEVDLSFHCSIGGSKNHPGAKERASIRASLDTYALSKALRYRSGVLGLGDYAQAFNASRVCVNWPRTRTNRPHRVLDVMAARSCLLTGKIPTVDGDGVEDGKHYIGFTDEREMLEKLDWLFEDDTRWQAVTDAGYQHVMNAHTWRHCATRLRKILNEELGI